MEEQKFDSGSGFEIADSAGVAPPSMGELGELFGTDWPEIAEKKLISVPNLSREHKGFRT